MSRYSEARAYGMCHSLFVEVDTDADSELSLDELAFFKAQNMSNSSAKTNFTKVGARARL